MTGMIARDVVLPKNINSRIVTYKFIGQQATPPSHFHSRPPQPPWILKASKGHHRLLYLLPAVQKNVRHV